MIIVQKYGGTSVASTEKILNVANKIAQSYLENNDIVIVLSAQGNTTDILLSKAKEISPNPSKRELDALLSTGEVQSAALMAIALEELGLPAISLNARQACIFSTAEHGCAKIASIDTDRIKLELEKRNIVIITGFQGVAEHGDTTTLGRGASDTTAIALAAALSANLCEIYTDVEGIFTADPRIVENALKHEAIGYDEMLELSSMGASVLHNRSVELAKKFDVNFFVKSSTLAAEPSQIKEMIGIEEKTICGITADKSVCKISLSEIEPTCVPRVMHLLASSKISADIVTYECTNKIKSLSFSIPFINCKKTCKILESGGSRSNIKISVKKDLAKLSVIGAGIAYDTNIISLFYETLLKEEIEIHLLSLSATKISALVAEAEINRAISALHFKYKKAGVLRPRTL